MFRKKQPDPKPELVAEFYTGTAGLIEAWPVLPAAKMMPEWFKASSAKVDGKAARQQHPPGCRCPQDQPSAFPRPMDNAVTIRSCPGLIDVMRMGYILRAWTDIEILTEQPPSRNYDPSATMDPFISNTGMRQGDVGAQVSHFPPMLNQKLPAWEGEYNFVLKFDTPWACRLPPGWSLQYMAVPYLEKTPWRVVPGLVDADTYHQVNILARWDHHGSYLIEAGTPLCALLPVRRDGFQMPLDVQYDREKYIVMKSLGKNSPGDGSTRLIHGTYAKARKTRERESASDLD